MYSVMNSDSDRRCLERSREASRKEPVNHTPPIFSLSFPFLFLFFFSSSILPSSSSTLSPLSTSFRYLLSSLCSCFFYHLRSPFLYSFPSFASFSSFWSFPPSTSRPPFIPYLYSLDLFFPFSLPLPSLYPLI